MLVVWKRRWPWLIVTLIVFSFAVQTATAWDMIPPAESVKNATDDFDPAWRLEAGRTFSELRNSGKNNTASYILILFLIIALGLLFHLTVKYNHMEQTSKRVRSDMLRAYTRMWLISRWGLRY